MRDTKGVFFGDSRAALDNVQVYGCYLAEERPASPLSASRHVAAMFVAFFKSSNVASHLSLQHRHIRSTYFPLQVRSQCASKHSSTIGAGKMKITGAPRAAAGLGAARRMHERTVHQSLTTPHQLPATGTSACDDGTSPAVPYRQARKSCCLIGGPE